MRMPIILGTPFYMTILRIYQNLGKCLLGYTHCIEEIV
ncbi:uncharacterized protein METZ01_LOCUS305217, partial [marine metagenome]